MAGNALKLVIFDLDGTLIDSQDHIVAAMARAFAAVDRPPPPREAVKAIVGLSLEAAVARLAPDMCDKAIAETVAAYRAGFLSLRAEGRGEDIAPLYPGVREALERLHAIPEVLLGVATGKARRGLDHACRVHDLEKFFVTRQTADLHPSKPHPSMVHAALSETGVSADRAIMVGDTTFDIDMGRSAGIRTIGVAWGYHPVAALRAARADCVIERMADLGAALDEIWTVTA